MIVVGLFLLLLGYSLLGSLIRVATNPSVLCSMTLIVIPTALVRAALRLAGRLLQGRRSGPGDGPVAAATGILAVRPATSAADAVSAAGRIWVWVSGAIAVSGAHLQRHLCRLRTSRTNRTKQSSNSHPEVLRRISWVPRRKRRDPSEYCRAACVHGNFGVRHGLRHCSTRASRACRVRWGQS